MCFFDDESDVSSCIYVDSSELNSSSSVSDTSVSFPLNAENGDQFTLNAEDSDLLNNLKFYYTNADCLLNKIDELEILIQVIKPDIIIVTEVFPKNLKVSNIDSNEYKVKGF